MRGAKDALLLRSLRGYAHHICAALLLSLVGLAHAQFPAPCSPALGRVVSLQGSIELLRSGSASWQRLTRLDTPVCRGDQLRAGLLSRAAMYISPETLVRLDQNTTLELVDQTEAETVLRFHQDEFTRRLAAQSNFCGVGYFITRFPRKLRVRTPFYNAVVEGTEFQVAMTCDRGELAVFEGKVAAESLTASDERVLLESGQSTSVGIGETPIAIKTIVKPSDAVQWALYYLPLTDVSLLSDAALEQNCAQLSVELRSGCLIRRAEYLLRVGRAQEARAELSGLLLAEPNNGDVLALQSIIAVVQNDKPAALDFAQRAIDAAPNSFRPYAALSYALQANFKLEEALNAAKRASDLAPDSALLRARNAELQLSLGRVRSAEREAIEAVRLNPNESRAHLILGFVHLAQIDTKKATADFNTAIELDSTEPLARLGLGLATIREGRLQEGREQIEIAVALDPTNSLVRSYVGKAYYEENSKARDQLAATQFGLAKSMDPNDPTPWFYDAILKQTQNRPVEALEDLQKSIELNDNRAVYRSRLSLDSDIAGRMNNIALIYNDVGLDQRARSIAADAILFDPAASAPHRFLAQSLGQEERTEITRISEQLTADLLESRRSSLYSVREGETDLGLLTSLTNAHPSAWEQPLFISDGWSGYAGALAGNHNTIGDEIGVSTDQGRGSLSLGQLYFRSDGSVRTTMSSIKYMAWKEERTSRRGLQFKAKSATERRTVAI
jgi:tetratricopeptide (TPR) repeat protein